MRSRKSNLQDAKRKAYDKLDQALRDTFPASDPVSFIEPAPQPPGEARPQAKSSAATQGGKARRRR